MKENRVSILKKANEFVLRNKERDVSEIINGVPKDKKKGKR